MRSGNYCAWLIEMRGNAACVPRRLPGYPQTLAFALLSGTSNTVPSTAITRNPLKKAPGVSSVANGCTTRSNSWLITLHPTRCRAALIDELLGTFQYFPSFVHCLLKPLTRFLSTVPIESDDHKLIAIIKHTTSCDGSLRLRSSTLSVLLIVWAIASGEMTVSIAFKTAADSMTGQMKENSLSCIGSNGFSGRWYSF